jgi:hypothetical protein
MNLDFLQILLLFLLVFSFYLLSGVLWEMPVTRSQSKKLKVNVPKLKHTKKSITPSSIPKPKDRKKIALKDSTNIPKPLKPVKPTKSKTENILKESQPVKKELMLAPTAPSKGATEILHKELLAIIKSNPAKDGFRYGSILNVLDFLLE